MEYDAIIRREGRHLRAEFPDCPGCQTFADSEAQVRVEAREALAGWLMAHLDLGRAPPVPRVRKRAPAGARIARIEVDPALAVAVRIRQARAERDLTQAQLAKRAGVSQQQIAKLERPGENPTIATLLKVASALGMSLDVRIEAA